LLPAEAQLLLLAVKPVEPGDDDAIARLLAAPIDWRQFVAIAERERLSSVAWSRLRPSARSVPRDVARALDARVVKTHLQLAALTSLLPGVIRCFSSADIPAMLLKGAALGTSVYPSYAHRPMNDLDVLVPADAAERAWEALRADGWTCESESDDPSFYRDHHHLQPLAARNGGVIELHRSIVPVPGAFVLDDTDLWRTARRTGDAWVPSPEYQLLHACVHLAWSDELNSGIVRAARDVATIVSVSALEWDRFARIAERARAATCAHWTLALARTLMRARVPSSVLDRLRPRQPRVLSRVLERAYIASGVLGLSPSVFLTHSLWRAGVHPVRSGHGATRPWDTTTRFYEMRQASHDAPLVTRLRMQMRDAGAWFRFARTVGGLS
jgi:hypothetical protein